MLKNGSCKFVKVHVAVLQWVSEQFLKNENEVGEGNVNNAIQNGVNFETFSIHYSLRLVKGNLASLVFLTANWKW